jgi:hypothetical protein
VARLSRILRRIPPIFFVAPGILAGILVPTVIVPAPKATLPPNTAKVTFIGMTFMNFTQNNITLHHGQYLTFIDTSRNIHEIGPGHDGRITTPVRGDPLIGFHLMQTNDVYKTGPWLTPGTFYVTCAIHPMMNLTVVVVP